MVKTFEGLRHECPFPPWQGQRGCGCFESFDYGSVSHVEEEKKELVKYVHRLSRLGVRLEYSLSGGFMVHHNPSHC